jgi:hypothetical protein
MAPDPESQREENMAYRVALALTAVLIVAGTAGAEFGGKIPWVKDHDAAMKEAGKTGKPTLVYFTADW